MNATFQALMKEAQFTLEMLGAGANQIRVANYAQKGIYFQAFTNLSTGLERIGKLCLMLDYYLLSGGDFPDKEYMKNEIGHNLEKLYLKSQEIIAARQCSMDFLLNLNDPIHTAIINVLSGFARGDRYSNIDLLVGESRSSDPVLRWSSEVDQVLFESKVPQKMKEQIRENAEAVSAAISPFSHVLFTSETGEIIDSVDDSSYRTGVKEAVAPLRQLYILQIIRYWIELLGELQYMAMSLGKQDIPYFTEIFARFYNEDSYFKSRKTWDRN